MSDKAHKVSSRQWTHTSSTKSEISTREMIWFWSHSWFGTPVTLSSVMVGSEGVSDLIPVFLFLCTGMDAGGQNGNSPSPPPPLKWQASWKSRCVCVMFVFIQNCSPVLFGCRLVSGLFCQLPLYLLRNSYRPLGVSLCHLCILNCTLSCLKYTMNWTTNSIIPGPLLWRRQRSAGEPQRGPGVDVNFCKYVRQHGWMLRLKQISCNRCTSTEVKVHWNFLVQFAQSINKE